MRREVYKIPSSFTNKDMEIIVYGHFGINFLMFPITDDDPYEYEKIGLIEAIEPIIEKGHIKLFSIEASNLNSWLNDGISFEERSHQHYLFNQFVANEVKQFIYDDNGSPVPIITCGAGLGGYHSVNSYLRRPDIFIGSIGANTFYDIQWLSKNYYDENCYYNSPIHYLPNLEDNYWLSFLQSQKHIYLIAEQGNMKMINQANRMGDILQNKKIDHRIEIVDCSLYPNNNVNKTMLSSVFRLRM